MSWLHLPVLGVLARKMFFLLTFLGLLLPFLCHGAFLQSDADPSPYHSILGAVKRSGSPRDAYLVVTIFISGPTVYSTQYDTSVLPIHAALEFAPTSTDGAMRVEVVAPAENQISIRAVDVGDVEDYDPPNNNISQYQAQEVWYLGQVAVTNLELVDNTTGAGLINTAWGLDRSYRINGHNSNDLTIALAASVNLTFPGEVQTMFTESDIYISSRGLSTTIASVPLQLAIYGSAGQTEPTVHEFTFTDGTNIAPASSPQNTPQEVIEARADTDPVDGYQTQQILTGPDNLNAGCTSSSSNKPITPRNTLDKRSGTWGCGGKVNATAAKLRLGGPSASVLIARAKGELSVFASLAEDVIKLSGYTALALAPPVIILDFINGQWEAATLASIGLAAGIALDALIAGPIGFLVGAVVAFLFNFLPGLFKADVRPSSKNMTQIIQYAFYHNKDTTGDEKCNANRTSAGLPQNCMTLYGPGVLSSVFKWETFDAVAFLVQFNDGHPMTIPDIVDSFYNIDWTKKGDGAGKVATVNCFPNGVTYKDKRQALGAISHHYDTDECPSPKFSIDRTLINIPVINQTAAQIYPRIISNNGGDCKILSDSPNGVNYPAYNLTITGRPSAFACNITASTDVGPTSSPPPDAGNSTSNTTGPASIVTDLPGWTFQSCYNDSTTDRTIVGSTTVNNDSMTAQWCAANCAGNTYFGIEFGHECYCGNSLSTSTVTIDNSQCNMPCIGNVTTACGASFAIQIYAYNSSTSTPSTQPSLGNTTSDGSIGRGYVKPPEAFPFVNLTGATLACVAGSKGNMCFPSGSYDHQGGQFGYSSSGSTELNMPPGSSLNLTYNSLTAGGGSHNVMVTVHKSYNANQSATDKSSYFGGIMSIFGGPDGNTGSMDISLLDNSPPVICIYTNTNYKGDAACFGAGGGDLPAIYQSKAQSLSVHGNASAWLYAQSYGDTSAQFVSTSVQDLKTIPYNVNQGFSKQLKALWVDVPRAS